MLPNSGSAGHERHLSRVFVLDLLGWCYQQLDNRVSWLFEISGSNCVVLLWGPSFSDLSQQEPARPKAQIVYVSLPEPGSKSAVLCRDGFLCLML